MAIRDLEEWADVIFSASFGCYALSASYIFIAEYHIYYTYFPVLCLGIMLLPLGVFSLAYCCHAMWGHGLRPLGYERYKNYRDRV